jgi:transglutaminase-like putative cysteine protease
MTWAGGSLIRTVLLAVLAGTLLPLARTAGAADPFELPVLAADAKTEQHWMHVLIGGRRVGVMETTRRDDGSRVETTESMRMVLERSGSEVSLDTRTTSIETSDGTPLAFRSESRLSGQTQVVEGRIEEGIRAVLSLSSPTGHESRTIPWQAGAVLVDGAERLARKQSLAPGTTWRHVSFDASSLLFVPVESRVIGRETIEISGQRRELTRIRQSADLAGSNLQVDGWHTADHALVRALMPMFGMELELVACEGDCSDDPIQAVDLFDFTLTRSPRALPVEERAAVLVHTVKAPSGIPLPPATGGQSVEAIGAGFRIRVDPIHWRGGGSAPGDTDSRANRWLEANDPVIQRAAHAATADAGDTPAKLEALVAYVRETVSNKTLDVGYASARETLDARAGDCTEHAVLLAALARAIDIPARVVSGIAYTPEWAGREHVFVPHAWVEAWTGSRWESLDAALPEGFGSGHLALATGDGEPSGFFAAAGLLGQIEITAIESDVLARERP